MLTGLYLLLVGLVAFFLQTRVALLDSFRGLPRFLISLGLTLFLAAWVNFLLFVALGWSPARLWLSWVVLLVPLFAVSRIWKMQGGQHVDWSEDWQALKSLREFDGWFLFLTLFVVARFYAGLDLDVEGNVWTAFNFVDTAFHLSVVNSFLAATGFPPMDLDMAPYPLKYHFIADFFVAHLTTLGITPLTGIWCMNLLSATVMVGAVWAAFQRWLALPARWLVLGALIFLFLNPALLNLVHYAAFHPKFLDPENPFYGLLRFPYFNFESMQSNLLEPQRSLLFCLPIALLVLHAAFEPGDAVASRARTIQAFVLVCLLPLGHIVAFAVVSLSLLPRLWQHRGWFLSRFWIWTPALVIGLLQLWYLRAYGPPTNAEFSAWSWNRILPLQDFAALPASTRRIAFWFFANGDFLAWGAIFALLGYLNRSRIRAQVDAAPGVWEFCFRWRWYFAVCGGYFLLMNFFRYSFDWGDSNKFVFFLNLGLTLIIALGAAQWIHGRGRVISHALWLFFFTLCVGPFVYSFYDNVIAEGHGRGTVLLFEQNGRRTAAWAKSALQPHEVILTAAYTTFHFVTPLTGRPTLAGIYGDSNPYRQDDRKEAIRRVYEEGKLEILRELRVRYVCVSRHERRKYKLNPRWEELMRTGRGVAFTSGAGPSDAHSVYIFDSSRLMIP